MPSPRIKQMKEEHVPKHFSGDGFIKPIHISVLRNRYYTESWKETEGQPTTIRRAKALARWLDNMPLYIRPFEMIVGYFAEDPNTLDWGLENCDSKILEEYIKGGYAKEDEVKEWRELMSYWKSRGLDALFKSLITEEEDMLSASNYRLMEVRATQFTSRTMPDHDLYLKTSLNDTLEKLRQTLEDLQKQNDDCGDGPTGVELKLKMNDVKAMIIAGEGFLRWAHRYSDLAKSMAEKETNPQRKRELLTIAEVCDWVPANPPRNFHEALQSHWLIFLGYHAIELLCHGTSLRLDDVFWPWYEKDVLIDKTLPREKALELMEEFLLHVDELGRPIGLTWRRPLQGVNFLATYTIGGVKPQDGSDACNELTILILDALDDLRMSHPDFKFRWHPKVDPRVWRRVVEVIRSGLGQPSIKNDTVIIPGLMDHYGFTLEEARSWAVVGCISPAPTINWGRYRRDAWSIRPAKVLELAFFNGVDPVPYEGGQIKKIGPETGDATKVKTFDEFMGLFRKQLAFCCRKSAHIKTIGEYADNILLKRPFASLFFHRSLAAGRDIMDCPEKGMPWVNVPGTVDVVDSLISLKKVVFVDKKYTMAEVAKALRANWEGYEDMRQEFVKAPKFGNDDDFADEVAVQVYSMLAEELGKTTDINGASPMPSGIVTCFMFLLAPFTGALTNGRKLGDAMADGGINPFSGYDRNGPMAAVLSAAKIDALKQKANIFNQKFSVGSVEGESGLRKLQAYLEATMHLGLDMVQFNITDVHTLKDAQKHPEKYPDLVVRISGYNAHFIDLNKFVQDAVIARTEHAMC